MNKDEITKIIKDSIFYLMTLNNDLDKDCIKSYIYFIKEIDKYNIFEIRNILYEIKDKFHPEMNTRYVNNKEYYDKFIKPIQELRIEIMRQIHMST